MQPSFARHCSCLDEQNITADRRPCQSGCNARQARAQCNFVKKLLRTEISPNVVPVDSNLFFETFGDASCHTAAYGSQLTLELSHSGFAGVSANNFADCGIGKSYLIGAETVFSCLPRN